MSPWPWKASTYKMPAQKISLSLRSGGKIWAIDLVSSTKVKNRKRRSGRRQKYYSEYLLRRRRSGRFQVLYPVSWLTLGTWGILFKPECHSIYYSALQNSWPQTPEFWNTEKIGRLYFKVRVGGDAENIALEWRPASKALKSSEILSAWKGFLLSFPTRW